MLPNPWHWAGPGRVGKNPACPGPGANHLPLSALFSPVSLLPTGDSTQTRSLSEDGDAGPFPTATTDQGQGLQPSNSQKPSLFIFHSCRPAGLRKPRMSGFRKGTEGHVGTDPPRNGLRTLLRLVRSEKQFNNKLYRIGNVQKCPGGCWLVSRLPPGGPQLCPSVLCKAPGAGGRGAPGSARGEDRPAHPAEACQGAGAGGACPGAVAPAGSVGFRQVSVLPLCPPLESVHAGVGS